MKLSREELKGLMKAKLMKAGLNDQHADITAEILTWSDERGYHSHGAVRMEYYCERIFKGGITQDPKFEWKETGPASAIFEGDNGCGYVAATFAMEKAIEMAKNRALRLWVSVIFPIAVRLVTILKWRRKKGCYPFHSASQTQWQCLMVVQSLTTAQTQFLLPHRLMKAEMWCLIWQLPCRLGGKF